MAGDSAGPGVRRQEAARRQGTGRGPRLKPYQRLEREKRDREAPAYDEWYVSNKGVLFDVREREVFTGLVGSRRARAVLDVGAGTGRVTEAVAPLAGMVVPVDLSTVSLGLLAAKGIPSARPVCANAAALPFRDGAFDVAVSCQVLERMQFDDLLRCLGEVHRVLAPGGRFVFSAYNLPYWGYRGVVELGDEAGAYVRPLTEGSVRYLADKHGFRVQHLGYYKALPFWRLKGRAWLTVDRVAGEIPVLRRKLNALMVAVLQRGP